MKSDYFVKDGLTLGYVDPRQPHLFWPLAAKIGGHDWRNGCTSTFAADMVPATLADFHAFRVCPKGHIDTKE